MPGLADLDPEAKKRLTEAFATARRLKALRAAFARDAGVEVSTVQALEGRRESQVSEDMIARLTVAVGWSPDLWREIASGATIYDPNTDDLPRSPVIHRLEAENRDLARRVAELEQTIDELRQQDAGEG